MGRGCHNSAPATSWNMPRWNYCNKILETNTTTYKIIASVYFIKVAITSQEKYSNIEFVYWYFVRIIGFYLISKREIYMHMEKYTAGHINSRFFSFMDLFMKLKTTITGDYYRKKVDIILYWLAFNTYFSKLS